MLSTSAVGCKVSPGRHGTAVGTTIRCSDGSGRIVRIDNIGLMMQGVSTLGFTH